jgi:hypothetical protein
MTTRTQTWLVAGMVLVGLLLGFGCDPTLLPYFLCGGPEALRDPKFQSLAPDKKKDGDRKESKVAILVYNSLDMRPEYVTLERDLAETLSQHLKKRIEHNDEKVTLVPSRQVETYKDKHPGWKAQELQEIGEALHADYVIFLEIQRMDFYEPGSGSMLYHGHAGIKVVLEDVHHPDDQRTDVYLSDYPSKDRPIQAEDISAQKFRLDFLNRVGDDLSKYFSAYPLQDDLTCE